jgi:hypothetical protein
MVGTIAIHFQGAPEVRHGEQGDLPRQPQPLDLRLKHTDRRIQLPETLRVQLRLALVRIEAAIGT